MLSLVYQHRPPITILDDMYADFEAWYMAHHAVYVTPCVEVPNGLRRIKLCGAAVAIAAMRTTKRSDLVFDYPWSRWINFVIGGDQVKRRKPDQDCLVYTVARYEKPKNRYVHLGDNGSDAQAARRGHYHILCAGALWEAENPQTLKTSRPDILFKSFEVFSRWITQEPVILTRRPCDVHFSEDKDGRSTNAGIDG